MKDDILIIDAYGFVFRAFYIQPRLTTSDGLPISAVYGFTSMIIKLLNDFETRNIVIVFDGGGKNFRHALYPEYKANRPPLPEDLRVQLPLVREVAESFNLSILEKVGVEADDIIATVAKLAAKQNKPAIVVSADKDLFQLIDGEIKLYDPVNNKFVTNEDVENKFGVKASQVRDYLSIVGDKSDNIPGVAGIGAKGAADLLTQYVSLANIFDNIDMVESVKRRQSLIDNKDMAMLSWELVGLRDIDIDFTLESFAWSPPAKDIIGSFVKQYNFKSLAPRIEKLCGFSLQDDRGVTLYQVLEIIDQESLFLILNNIVDKGYISLIIEPDKLYFTINSLEAYTINFSTNTSTELLSILMHFIDDDSIIKITYNIKNLLHILADKGISVNNFVGFHDLMLMYYLHSKTAVTNINLNDLSYNLLGQDIFSHQKIFYVHRLFSDMQQALMKEKLLHVYYDVDLPILNILYEIEFNGVKIDSKILGELSQEYNTSIKLLEQQIFTICGKTFNIASPKQLGEVLFEWLRLPGGKISAKSKSYSTDVETLEKLSELGFEGADLLLQWRRLNKLVGTYILPLLEKALNNKDRIHTTLLQTSTLTARLSSMEPNLQNIPIKTPEGSKIRKAFIVENGNKLISADYSQIELRILSHMAEVKKLKDAFIKKQDIHTITACEIFQTTAEKVTAEQRRSAKTINFGIIYGISPFGLAKQLKISNKEAKDYIDLYFRRYPEILQYMEITKEFAAKFGYVKTISGRKCAISNINAANSQLKMLAERTAINAPIQGSAADIVRLAMIAVQKALKAGEFKTKIILQIHDELLFEAPENEVNEVIPVIKYAMENILQFSIPLTVNIAAADNWYDCK